MLVIIKREAYQIIERINKTFRVLLVSGPRQAWKTTLLTSCLPENMNYVTLDDTKKEIGSGGIICCYESLTHLNEKNYIIPISSVINRL